MREAVSDILDLRAREAEGLSRMVLVSLAAHAVLLAIVWLLPSDWRSGPRPQEDVVRMTISLGGSPGPNAGGMTQISGRPVQAVAPPEPRRVELPPMPKAPEMVAPEPMPASMLTSRPACLK